MSKTTISDSGLLIDGPQRARTTIVLAHGAGAPMDSPFMDFFAEQLAAKKYGVVRFEFPYMRNRRATGKRSPPNAGRILEQTWLDVIESLSSAKRGAKRLFIGGKSMGGRIASMIADGTDVAGLICLGYPFHPPGKPDRLRTGHLQAIQTLTLILQGERDTFGNAGEVSAYQLSSQLKLSWLPDGDHSFKPRKSSGLTEEENWLAAVDRIAEFVGG